MEEPVEVCGWLCRVLILTLSIVNPGISKKNDCQVSNPIGDYMSTKTCERQRDLLTMFTTFKPSEDRNIIHGNVIKNWAAISDDVILYTSSDDVGGKRTMVEAINYGWTVHAAPRTNPYNLPFVKDMFLDASALSQSEFVGYSNGDILFTANLRATLVAILHSVDPREVFIIGRRKNVLLRQRTLHLEDHVQMVADVEAEDYLDVAIDYFIFHQETSFPFGDLPDLVVGRSRYDNFLVSKASASGMMVVDASETITALHQTGTDGNLSGHMGKGAKWNINILGSFNYLTGSLKAATHRTVFENGAIRITGNNGEKTKAKLTQKGWVPSKFKVQNIFEKDATANWPTYVSVSIICRHGIKAYHVIMQTYN
ncbi:hypothetical protein CAPTEDRAFT_191652 [Capitella teleta]|uniref:Uncharacterized protein n=1 Tax=Capitella teleta TaxID=283909 RepID=R7TE27_CAPTE|nr:hypothetical protein CAPTEDRAFT_191652 [Capitella teleta]|eukprot:ELT91762.1 hypothetical protein CAPTEDRAFT_191652 [Capitella teleta]